jgi:hypothetical protein
MPTLRVDLQEGFQDDTVTVWVGDEELQRSHVSTRLQTGYAGSLEVQVQEGAADVEVALPSRGTSKSIPVAFGGADTVYLGLSVVSGDEISARVSHRPFRYL